ncbi:hypothetical protein [Pseudarthrobacter sp. SSS035]|uniref:hypothetical protein n=1 Tax=Pseudarthrobacter sp. SSS035 TaxID=2931399 RepID=UPI00200F47F6|nr:hypothetical protein [Pseudarthrobacter sp. SSS035]
MFENEDALFSLDAPAQVLEEKKIDHEQIRQLKAAFEEAGITDVAAQREVVSTCVFRPYESLEDLLSKDVRPILKRIQSSASHKVTPVSGSAWDNREGDTWIDKM